MEKNYVKIYDRVYDNAEGKAEPNLLGEFEIIFGSVNEYAFSAIGVKKEDGKPYNIIGDEVSGFYSPGQGGTKIRIVEIPLQKEHWC